jgi:hypothetical protein
MTIEFFLIILSVVFQVNRLRMRVKFYQTHHQLLNKVYNESTRMHIDKINTKTCENDTRVYF